MKNDIVNLELGPGDVSIHHPNIIHDSKPNTSNRKHYSWHSHTFLFFFSFLINRSPFQYAFNSFHSSQKVEELDLPCATFRQRQSALVHAMFDFAKFLDWLWSIIFKTQFYFLWNKKDPKQPVMMMRGKAAPGINNYRSWPKFRCVACK